MAHSNGTTTNPAAENWGITDQVIQLRILGSDVVYPLSDLGAEPTLGASVECSIKIDDPAKQVSRRHARLVRTPEAWLVFDLSSKNGIHIDGLVPLVLSGTGELVSSRRRPLPARPPGDRHRQWMTCAEPAALREEGPARRRSRRGATHISRASPSRSLRSQ